MVASANHQRVTGPEERRHGTCFGNYKAYGAMAKASVPIPSIQGSIESLIQS